MRSRRRVEGDEQIAKDGEEDVDELGNSQQWEERTGRGTDKVSTAAPLEEDSERRDDDGDNDLDSVVSGGGERGERWTDFADIRGGECHCREWSQDIIT